MRVLGLVLPTLLFAVSASAEPVAVNDWLQLYRDAGRTACSPVGVGPPYRARWIGCGPGKTLRNGASNPAWPDDPTDGAQPGVHYPMPASVPFTLAGRVQPVVGNRIFVGDIDGQ